MSNEARRYVVRVALVGLALLASARIFAFTDFGSTAVSCAILSQH